MKPVLLGAAAEYSEAPGRGELVCGVGGCGRCCECGEPFGSRRRLAFPAGGVKLWVCPTCFTRLLDDPGRAGAIMPPEGGGVSA